MKGSSIVPIVLYVTLLYFSVCVNAQEKKQGADHDPFARRETFRKHAPLQIFHQWDSASSDSPGSIIFTFRLHAGERFYLTKKMIDRLKADEISRHISRLIRNRMISDSSYDGALFFDFFQVEYRLSKKTGKGFWLVKLNDKRFSRDFNNSTVELKRGFARQVIANFVDTGAVYQMHMKSLTARITDKSLVPGKNVSVYYDTVEVPGNTGFVLQIGKKKIQAPNKKELKWLLAVKSIQLGIGKTSVSAMSKLIDQHLISHWTTDYQRDPTPYKTINKVLKKELSTLTTPHTPTEKKRPLRFSVESKGLKRKNGAPHTEQK